MANKKIGCSSFKTTIVDPNTFDGHSSVSNISVPLEDLSILVELTTSKKARTILTTNKEGAGGGESAKAVRVNFIEGSNVGGKKSLTTKFTDLTTVFDGSNEGENLGITAIDIDFNSQVAPMVTIQFVDVRGSAIFQNDEKIRNNDNKYSVFFQLPYPLYELTIKGYYGQPVKYCLHMTKFTSRFNSQTGNFEITASFIGYTYAMLSDMLLGYLKAIEYTDLGKAKYAELRKEVPTLLSLNDLYIAISNINQRVNKLLATDEDNININAGKDSLEKLNLIRNTITILGQSSYDMRQDLINYEYFIVDIKTENLDTTGTKSIAQPFLDTYNTSITTNINSYNTTAPIKVLDLGTFTKLEKIYADTDLAKLKADTNAKKVYDYISKNYKDILSEKSTFSVIDMTEKYKVLAEAETSINKQIVVLKKQLSETLRAQVRHDLGFDPTVRSIINVFTTAVEVFMSVLFDVSKIADDPATIDRTNELEKVLKHPSNSDIKNNASGSNSTPASGALVLKYYPWPDYRAESEETGFEEKYLGEASGLENADLVTELNFIDNLLLAFIKQATQEKDADLLLQEEVTNWYPVNPLDTRMFAVDNFPYRRIAGTQVSEVTRLVMLRAMTFLGQSNRNLTVAEIQSMANAEADALLADLPNQLVKQGLTQSDTNAYLASTGTISDKVTNIIKAINVSYYYDYIFPPTSTSASFANASDIKALPINKNFEGNWSRSNSDLIDARENGTLFLTNYIASKKEDDNNVLITKPDDGGVYVKIFDGDAYNKSVNSNNSMVSTQEDKNNVINLDALQKDPNGFKTEGVGFNVLGGRFGIQEFTTLNHSSAFPALPFRLMFYFDANTGKDTYNKSNGFGYKRGVKLVNQPAPPLTTPFDINPAKQTYPVFTNISEYMVGIDNIRSVDETLHKGYGKNLFLANKYISGDNSLITYPYVNFQVTYITTESDKDTNGSSVNKRNLAPVSLFGSRLYYEQKLDESKALLFLHTFPWRGLTEAPDRNDTIFHINEIVNTFSQRAGFVSVPKIWTAFIGGLLWRADYKDTNGGDTDPILFHNATESFIPTFENNLDEDYYPKKSEYLTVRRNFIDIAVPSNPMSFSTKKTVGTNYLPIDEILLTLPDQVKDEFKKAFSNFVTDEWQQIKKQLQVFDGTGSDWKTIYDAHVTNSTTLTTTSMAAAYANFDKYIIFSPIVGDDNFKYNYFLELKDGTQAVKQIMDLYVKESVIANTTFRIWGKNGDVDGTKNRDGIFVKQTDLKTYLDKIVTKLSPFKDSFSTVAIKKQQEVTLFGTSDENIIKLMLYKTCKNIYDKWIGGASDGDNVIFQCGGRNSVDTDLAKKRGSNSAKLIDSFRFITRSFKDIGDELAINPIPVATYLRDNPNSSVYDALGGLLSSNNFTFVPLPAFINYRDPKILESMFEAIPYYQAQTLTDDLCGPSFVCTYVGQTSKHLDYNDSNYTNDGFDVRCDGGTVIGLPKDYNTKAEDYEDVVTFFNVKFGQQNQNIFKDIALDQSEFSETAESLQIIDDISKKGAETNRSLAGQNIYNVYSVRSYKAEVEMLGNAMIQPMMQFQLDNIPMFHGAYMITRVKHSLKPNSMTTHFTGSRLRQATTKIFSSGDLYMSLLDSMDNANTATGGGGGTFTKSFPPIVATIIDDSGQNGVIKDSKIGTLPVKQIKVPKGILLNMKKDDNPILLSEAVDSLEKMLGDWLDWMTTSGFKGNAGNYAYINSAFRTYEVQERLKKEKGDNAATPGTSRHGWGIAIDFQFFRKNGEIIHNYVNKTPNVVEGYDFSINESIVWLLENSYTYGWIIPEELRDDTDPEEFWHFEYHARSAKCILEKKPKIKGKDINTTLDYKDIVKNPVDKDGKETVYDTCDFVTRKSIDGTFEIISPENVGIVITPPSSDDIAFYNAILTGINAPTTPENLKFFYAWRKAENGEAAWNPFNTTQNSDNTTNYNCNAGFPVKNYASKDLGIKATVETLTNRHYPKILEGLRKNVGAYKISTYVDELGTWGTGYGVNKVLAGANLVPPPISQTGKEASCPKLV